MAGRQPRLRNSEQSGKLLGALFTGPAVLVVLVLIAYPIGFTLYYSFHEWFVSSIVPPRFVGLQNYVQMFSDQRLWNSVIHSLYFVTLAVGAQLILGMVIAMLLNREFRGKNVVRTLFLLPMMATPSAIALILMMMFDPNMGIINYLLESIGIPGQLWLADSRLVIPTLALMDTWQWTPFMVLILLAGLSTLPIEPYEASLIDGASKFATFRYITLPLMRPTLIVALMFRIIDAWKTFDIIYVTTQGGPAWASETLNIYAWYNTLKYMHMGYGSSNLVLLSILVFILVFVFSKWRRSIQWSA